MLHKTGVIRPQIRPLTLQQQILNGAKQHIGDRLACRNKRSDLQHLFIIGYMASQVLIEHTGSRTFPFSKMTKHVHQLFRIHPTPHP